MKVSAKQYAKILWDLLKDKDDSQGKEIIGNFVKVLFKRKQLRLADKIMKSLREKENKENGLVQARVKSAYEVSDDYKEKIKKFIAKNIPCQGVELEFVLEKKLIGGVVVEAQGLVWDMSVSGGVRKLRKNIR